MKIATKELDKALNTIKPALAKKDIIAEGKAFFFTGEAIKTFNGQMGISYPFKTDFSCLVPAEELYRILSKVRAEEIEITHDKESGEIRIKAGKVKGALKEITQTEEGFVFPDIPKKAKDWVLIIPEFMEALLLTSFSVSTDMTKPYLTGVSIKGDVLSSSDNFRISQHHIKQSISDTPIIIPGSSVQELVKFKDSMNAVYVSDSWIYFKTATGLFFCSGLIGQEFPEVSQYFKIKGDWIELPDDLKDSIEIVSILAEGEFDYDKRIEINITKGKIICKGKQDKGWVTSETKFSGKDVDITFQINPSFLNEILSHSTKFIKSDNHVLFKSGKFNHLITLYSDEE